jgi:preprotein translocase subunit SecE
MFFKRWLASLLCCCLAATSCSTLRDVPLTTAPAPVSSAGLTLGDTVIVTLRDGSSQKLKVTQIDATSLSGMGKRGTAEARYAFADMASLEVRRVSFWKTTGVVGATLLVVGTALLLALISSLDDEE